MYPSLSVCAGALTAVMILMNGELARSIGVYGSSVVAHLTGLAAAGFVLLLSRDAATRHERMGPVALAGGAFGALAVVLASGGLVELGVPLALGLGLLGQTAASVVIDHFGLLGAPVVRFAWRRAAAMALITLGIAAISCS